MDRGGLRYSDSLNYGIECPDGQTTFPNGRKTFVNDGWTWKWSQKKVQWGIKNGFIQFKKTRSKKSGWGVYYKNYLNVDNEGNLRERKNPFKNIFLDNIKTGDGAKIIKEIFGEHVFKYSKPVELIQFLMKTYDLKNGDIVLDFMSGSGTTGHAVFANNLKNNSKINFILVQIPEKIQKSKYDLHKKLSSIVDISKTRLKFVIEKMINENQSTNNNVFGFKVFKLAKSNYKIWEEVQDEAKLKDQLKLFEDPLIENYKDMDVIYEIIIKEGYSLNSKIEEVSENPNKIYKVSDGEFFFYVTLDEKIDEKALEDLNLDKNIMFVCLDSAINDTQKTNLDKLCKLRTI